MFENNKRSNSYCNVKCNKCEKMRIRQNFATLVDKYN